MKYEELKKLNYADLGQEFLSKWKEEDLFRKSIELRKDAPTFTFYEGPPSANGKPGIHHVMARAVKDIFCRYKTMKGFRVDRKAGWDTHGLPVELQVEKELGITKEDIGTKISVADYNQRCRETVMKYTEQWNELTERIGYWVDLDNPYITYEPKYMETLWYLLKELYNKDLLYKGYTIQPYSPAAGTGLSSHELNQPGCYRNVKDTSITAQFKLKDSENSFFLAWTTTPWTLPANSALAVNPSITYVRVKTFNQYTHAPIEVWLAKDRLSAYFNKKAEGLPLEDYQAGDKQIPYEVVAEAKGKELIGKQYEQLLPYIQPEGKAFEVISGDFVSTEDGTGIVHISPTFGADDARVAKQQDIAPIMVYDEKGHAEPVVDKQGKFVAAMKANEQIDLDLAGKFVKEAYQEVFEPNTELPEKNTDVQISVYLKEQNRAFKVEKYEHSYPHCWRTDRPVLYYPLDSWFIKTTALKDKLVEKNKTINWKPESTGSGRFGHWLENLVDWNLSRSRYWGTPLPIWRTEDGQEERCIGSIKELRTEIERAKEAGFLPQDFEFKGDLHRPYVDEVVLVSESGKAMKREADLIDVWFDSGAMPYAQWHYPFGNEAGFKANYPADFIAEGVDQTRGWFFTLHALGVLLFDSVAYKNVIANGLVLDKNGNKMSKRLGNAIDPFETLDTYGPDPLRWYMISNAPPWDNLKFDLEGVGETMRKFFGTLVNTYGFFALYANIDGFTYEEEDIPLSERTESDCWVLSKLNTLIGEVSEAYDAYEPTQAARLIQDFTINDLSNWYVRLNRKRFWKGEYTEDKQAAYQTLHTCISSILKMAAPIAPFVSDKMYRLLEGVSQKDRASSIHLSDFPAKVEEQVDKELEIRMGLAQQVSSMVHSLRKGHKLKVRQPLRRILVPVGNETEEQRFRSVEALIQAETNVKAVDYVGKDSGMISKEIKPNFKALGKRLGPKMKRFAQIVGQMGQEDILEIEQAGGKEIEVEGEKEWFALEDFDIQTKDVPGWLVASEGGVTVALDINVDEDLKAEGLARELVNRVQNLRKDKGFDVLDKIHLQVASREDFVQDAIRSHKEYIAQEVQALDIATATELNGDAEDLDLDGYAIKVKLGRG